MTEARRADVRGMTGVNLGHLASATVSIAVLLLPFLSYIYIKTFGIFQPCSPDGIECADIAGSRLFIAAVWGGMLSLSAASGSLGTIVSFFLRQTRQDAINTGLTTIRPVTYIGLREIMILIFFGMTFGLLMIALFVGNFIEGNLFPGIKAGSWSEINIRIADWAKIFIWCFVAGFSERLIPDLLDNLVRQVEPKRGPPVTTTADARSDLADNEGL